MSLRWGIRRRQNELIALSPCRISSLPLLLAEICDNSASYDAVVLSHAMTRLAKDYRREAQRGGNAGPLRELVLPAVSSLCEQLPRLINDFDCWGVASYLWGLSLLNCYDQAVFKLLCNRGSLIAYAHMKPGDCAMIMLSFGRFGHYHPELLRCIPQVGAHACMQACLHTCCGGEGEAKQETHDLHASDPRHAVALGARRHATPLKLTVPLLQVMLRDLDQATAEDVHSVLWGFAKLGIPDAPGKVFMDAISDNLLWSIDQYGCQVRAMGAHARRL